MESQEEIRDLYRKLGFSAARRSHDDLAEVFVRFSSKRRRPGSELGQLLSHARDREPVTERLVAEGIADIDAFFAGSFHTEEDTLGDLLLERFLIRDMDEDERARVASRLDQSRDGRALLDRLLKQRLIFLADYPAEPFAERVAALQAAAAMTPPPRRRPRPSWRWLSIPVAAAATVALLGVGIFTQARSPEPSGHATPKVIAAKPLARSMPTPPIETPVATTPTPAPRAEKPAKRAITRERGKDARLLAYARAGSEVRPIADGDEIGDDERLVTWVKTSEAGYAAVISVEPERTRAFFAERGQAAAVPAGGPTRLGKGKPLPADEVELLLLVAAEPFSLRPILARMRRGGAATSVFDGTVRRLRIRAATNEVAAGQ